MIGASFQHHHVEVWDIVPNFFVTQKPNWGARVTLLPVHRYYRIAAQLPLLTAYILKIRGENLQHSLTQALLLVPNNVNQPVALNEVSSIIGHDFYGSYYFI